MESREIGPETPSPEHIQDLARACEDFVKRGVGTALDGTSDTLPLLDHYLRKLDPKDPAAVHQLVVSAAGAYFGELVRNRYVCRWFAPPGEPFRWRIEFETIFLHFNPVAVALEAIMRRESGLGASFETLEADQTHLRTVLDRIPAVRDDDFYTLALRLEVLDRLAAELFALTRSRGDREHWSAAEYRSIIDELPS